MAKLTYTEPMKGGGGRTPEGDFFWICSSCRLRHDKDVPAVVGTRGRGTLDGLCVECLHLLLDSNNTWDTIFIVADLPEHIKKSIHDHLETIRNSSRV